MTPRHMYKNPRPHFFRSRGVLTRLLGGHMIKAAGLMVLLLSGAAQGMNVTVITGTWGD